MTPTEKAMYLVEGIKSRLYSDGYYDAKQCAIFMIDEFLNFDIREKSESQFIIERRIEEYWQEVKQEIQKTL